MQVPDDMLTKLAMMGPPPSFPAMPQMPQQGGMYGGGLQPQAPMPPMRPTVPQSRQEYQMNPPTSIGAALVGG